MNKSDHILVQQTLQGDLRSFFQWADDHHLEVLAASRAHLEWYRTAMEQRGYAAATIDRRLCTVCGYYRFAHLDGRISSNPAQYVRRPKVQPSEGRGMDRGELARFLFTAEQYDHAHAGLAVLLGLSDSLTLGLLLLGTAAIFVLNFSLAGFQCILEGEQRIALVRTIHLAARSSSGSSSAVWWSLSSSASRSTPTHSTRARRSGGKAPARPSWISKGSRDAKAAESDPAMAARIEHLARRTVEEYFDLSKDPHSSLVAKRPEIVRGFLT